MSYTSGAVSTIASGSVTTTEILDGTIANADVSSSAAIAYSKLNLTGNILNADINASAAIAGSKLATLSVGGPPTIVRRTSASGSKVNNTLANDDTLLWAATTTSVDFFEGYLIVNCAAATVDFQSAFSIPASMTGTWASQSYSNLTVTSFQGAVTSSSPAADVALTTAINVGTNTTHFVWAFAGWALSGGTGGNVNLQWAQVNTDAGNGITLSANSFLRITRFVA